MSLAIPEVFDYPACVKCAGCGGVIELAWTSSCVGYRIYCGTCWAKKQ